MQLLPHIFKILDKASSGAPSYYRVVLADSDWIPEYTDWMNDAEMPDGCVLRAGIDIVLAGRNFEEYPAAIDYLSKLMDFCKFVKDNQFPIELIKEHLEYRNLL